MQSLEMRVIIGREDGSPKLCIYTGANDNLSREQELFERAVSRELVDDWD